MSGKRAKELRRQQKREGTQHLSIPIDVFERQYSEKEYRELPYAAQFVNVFGNYFEGIWRVFDDYRERWLQRTTWPAAAWIPLDATMDVLASDEAVAVMKSAEHAERFRLRCSTIGTTLAPWRLTKGIFRFNPDLATELARTDGLRQIPTDVFTRLPHWSVFVDVPTGIKYKQDTFPGFFAALTYRLYKSGQSFRSAPVLVIYLIKSDANDPYIFAEDSIILDLGTGDIEQALREKFQDQWDNREALDAAGLIEREHVEQPDYVENKTETTLQQMQPMLSLLLYLCADDSEGVESHDKPEISGVATQRSRFPRFVPASGSRVFQIGYRIGSLFRARREARDVDERLETEVSSGKRMPTHVRSAHWHAYLYGKRDEARERRLRWLHPIIVNANDGPVLPTIRPVAAQSMTGETAYEG